MFSRRVPALHRRPRLPAARRRHLAAGLALLLGLLSGAAINGWRWLPTGNVVIGQVQGGAAGLPESAPLSGRVLVISPHPDDETLAVGGIIQDVLNRGGQVDIVFLTSGDGFAWDARATEKKPVVRASDLLRLGEARMNEATQAAQVLGVDRAHVTFLGFPDKGLQRIYLQNYLTPYTSRQTGMNRVPYQRALHPGTPYTGQELERQMNELLTRLHPDIVLAPSVRDHHPDHQVAAFLAGRLAPQHHARLYAYMVHGGVEWPLPKGNHPQLPLSPPSRSVDGQSWQRYPLSAAQEQRKAQAVSMYHSQLQIIPRFMQAFVRTNELLLPVPVQP
ncbi:PIG-L family deacetylase [Deinococcus sonorensis]|uniref:PIG-L family deacetylase n=2 Tax=Deinococcus sonorensis TaxID=309891 RepID=A0AAU7U7K9_9DEIO